MRKPDLVRIRVFVVFVFAITSGAVFAYATYRYVQQAPAKAGASMKTATVAVAAGNLAIGDELAADDIRMVEWPAASVPPSPMPSRRTAAGSRFSK